MSFWLIIYFLSLCRSLKSMDITPSSPREDFLSHSAILSPDQYMEFAPSVLTLRKLIQPPCNHGMLINNSCKCDKGYSGPDCLNCTQHYTQSLELLCHPSPEIISVSPAGLLTVYKRDRLVITLEFSQRPYLKSGQDSGFLLKGSDSSSLVPSLEDSSSAFIWLLTFDLSQALPGQAYKLILIEAAIVNADGESFELSELEMPMIFIGGIEKECAHGKIVREKCVCTKGYEGKKCDTCSDGYLYRAGLCKRYTGYVRYYIVYGSVGIILGFFIFHLMSNKKQKMESADYGLDSNDIDLYEESKQ